MHTNTHARASNLKENCRKFIHTDTHTDEGMSSEIWRMFDGICVCVIMYV